MSVISPALLTVPVKTKGCPSGAGLGGQILLTASVGVISVGQTAVAEALTLLPVHALAPVATSVSKYEQQLGGTCSLPVKFVDCPGARVTGPKTGVLFVGRSLTTITLVKVMLPALLTDPLKMARPPGTTGLAGQYLATAILGVVIPGQSLKALAVTKRPKHLSLPLAMNVSRYCPPESISGTYW